MYSPLHPCFCGVLFSIILTEIVAVPGRKFVMYFYRITAFEALITARTNQSEEINHSRQRFMAINPCPQAVFMDNKSLSTVVYRVTLREWIKEAGRTLRKQDPALPENRALNRCEVHLNSLHVKIIDMFLRKLPIVSVVKSEVQI